MAASRVPTRALRKAQYVLHPARVCLCNVHPLFRHRHLPLTALLSTQLIRSRSQLTGTANAQDSHYKDEEAPRRLRGHRERESHLLGYAPILNVEQILDDYAKKMRDAENESHEGKRKTESLWPIMRISHTRSRYIYELYYKREAISKELYDWLLKEGYADAK